MSVAKNSMLALFTALTLSSFIILSACAQDNETSDLAPDASDAASVLLNGPAQDDAMDTSADLDLSTNPAPAAKIDSTFDADLSFDTPDAPIAPAGVEVDLSGSKAVATQQDGAADLAPELPGSLKPIPDLDATQAAADANFGRRLLAMESRLTRIEAMVEAQANAVDQLANGAAGISAADIQALREELVRLRTTGVTAARPELTPESPLSLGTDCPTEGKLVVQHEGFMPYQLRINGKDWLVNPGRSELSIPLGTVATELVGYEATKLWQADDWHEVGGQKVLSIVIK